MGTSSLANNVAFFDDRIIIPTTLTNTAFTSPITGTINALSSTLTAIAGVNLISTMHFYAFIFINPNGSGNNHYTLRARIPVATYSGIITINKVFSSNVTTSIPITAGDRIIVAYGITALIIASFDCNISAGLSII